MSQRDGEDLVVRRVADPSVRIVEFRDRYLNYERTDELKPRLIRRIREATEEGARRFVLDLERFGVIDSCGLAALVSAAKSVRLAGGEIALCGLSEMIRRLFDLTGLDRVFEIHGTAREAVVALATERVA